MRGRRLHQLYAVRSHFMSLGDAVMVARFDKLIERRIARIGGEP